MSPRSFTIEDYERAMDAASESLSGDDARIEAVFGPDAEYLMRAAQCNDDDPVTFLMGVAVGVELATAQEAAKAVPDDGR